MSETMVENPVSNDTVIVVPAPVKVTQQRDLPRSVLDQQYEFTEANAQDGVLVLTIRRDTIMPLVEIIKDQLNNSDSNVRYHGTFRSLGHGLQKIAEYLYGNRDADNLNGSVQIDEIINFDGAKIDNT